METKKQESESESKKEEIATIYQCQIGCKTYDHEGNCPVCNRKLIPLDGQNTAGQTQTSC